MSNEEAINRLEEEIELYKPYAKTWEDARLDIEALNIAIQALKEQDRLPCDLAECDTDGCLGFAKNEFDDTPIEKCLNCSKASFNKEEKESE